MLSTVINLKILYQDERIVVCVKPSGILSTDEPGGMPALLRQELGTPCIRTVHRLDQAVSGLMVYARSVKAASLLSEQIRAHRFSKEYLAVVCGTLPQSCGTMTDLLRRDKTTRRTWVADTPGRDVQKAELTYQVLAVQAGLSLVRVGLVTGRTHQIRVQFASRGFPLAGDRKYGSEAAYPIALWSARLQFDHPQTGQALDFHLSPPQSAPWSVFSPFPEWVQRI
jgi:23S rRNA pseudouridine1911/1915/1917 synthase